MTDFSQDGSRLTLPSNGTKNGSDSDTNDNMNNDKKEIVMSKKMDLAHATTTPEPESQPAPDTHDSSKKPDETDVLAQLRVSQDFASKLGAKKVITTVPIRNPKRNEFVRVHPTMEPMLVYTLVDEQETYVVTANIASSCPGETVPKLLVPTISRQGTLFLWPLRIPGDDGRIYSWHASAREAATRAVHVWLRVQANMALGAYEVYEAIGAIPDPDWPALTMDAVVRIAVKGRVIDTLDHPVLRKLRGEE
jgi:hypothetical protein